MDVLEKMSKDLKIVRLENAKLLEHAMRLPQKGTIKLTRENLLYLDIDDGFIHQLCPLLTGRNIRKPDYFSMGIGSHISIIYPNEFDSPIFQLGLKVSFRVIEFFRAETEDRIYYALTVGSQALSQIRSMNRLDNKLNLNGYIVDMHTTIGITDFVI